MPSLMRIATLITALTMGILTTSHAQVAQRAPHFVLRVPLEISNIAEGWARIEVFCEILGKNKASIGKGIMMIDIDRTTGSPANKTAEVPITTVNPHNADTYRCNIMKEYTDIGQPAGPFLDTSKPQVREITGTIQ